jgi:hypothetical protein
MIAAAKTDFLIRQLKSGTSNTQNRNTNIIGDPNIGAGRETFVGRKGLVVGNKDMSGATINNGRNFGGIG